MKIDLTCPVELWKYTLPDEHTPQCSFVLNNISTKHVVSVQITLTSYGNKEFVLLKQTDRLPVTDAPPGMPFTVSMLPTEWGNVQTVDLVIEKVWFADATVWRRGNAPVVEYEHQRHARRPEAGPASLCRRRGCRWVPAAAGAGVAVRVREDPTI